MHPNSCSIRAFSRRRYSCQKPTLAIYPIDNTCMCGDSVIPYNDGFLILLHSRLGVRDVCGATKKLSCASLSAFLFPTMCRVMSKVKGTAQKCLHWGLTYIIVSGRSVSSYKRVYVSHWSPSHSTNPLDTCYLFYT